MRLGSTAQFYYFGGLGFDGCQLALQAGVQC